MNSKLRHLKNGLLISGVTALASVTFSIVPVSVPQAMAAPSVAISSTPLNVIIPSTPQVMIALTNSNSMDSSDNITDDGTPSPGAGTHAPSSAIMTWSGNVGAGSLGNSTSPVNYTLPGSYTAPITGTTAGSTPYTAPINTYTVFGTAGKNWTCASWQNAALIDPATGVNWIAIPNPGTDPPPNFSSPNPAPVAWDDTQTWWFNNDGGASNGYYEGPSPPPLGASVNKVPSAREVFHGEAAEFALNANGGLFNVGMGNGPSGKPTPRVGGGGGGSPPPPPCCGPPPITWVCVLYKWTPQYPTSANYTPWGDNSASRMNIAKESIYQVIQTYSTQVDFGLMTYNVPSKTGYYSWAYYMSPSPSGFTPANFSNIYQAPTYAPAAGTAPPVLTSEWVTNPCWNAGGSVLNNCNSLASQTGLSSGNSVGALGSFQYMQVAARGDDPAVNDVLLSPWNGAYAFVANGTLTAPTSATPATPITTPYQPAGPFALTDYESGNVAVQYSATAPNIPYNGTYKLQPTNSGFVPYSPQVMFGLRGVLWAGTPSKNIGSIRVPVTLAPAASTTAQAAYLQMFSPFLTPENNMSSYPSDTGNVPGVSPAISYYNYYRQAIFSSAVQSPTAGLLSTALNAANWISTPGPSGCTPPKYVVLITDGLPTEDLNGNSWPPPGSAAAAGYGVTVANDQAVIDTINTIASLNSAGIKTFVVGMGPGVDPTLNPAAAQVLTAMAVAGGTKNYYPGTSPAAVVSQLNAILTIISSTTVASVSGAVSSYALPGANVYQATYTGYDKKYQDWTGDLQAFAVLPNGNASTVPNWSAQCQLDISATSGICGAGGGTGTGNGWSATRLIATWNPSSGAGVPFKWGNISAGQQTELQPSDALGQDRLNYLRGDTAEEIHNGGADGFRDRSHLLGDIVDSAPLFVGPSNGPYTSDPSYRSFVKSTQSRTATIYVGSNDGMLHAFNAGTGNEEFAFIPDGVFANLYKLTNPAYNSNHQYYVDGSPTAGDVKFSDNSWHTVLVGGLNDGGNSIYALDVTQPQNITSESGFCTPLAYPTSANCAVLWEFTDAHMGLSYSQPAFALTNDTGSSNANPNGFLLFFGSGYNNSDGNPYLYAVNPQTGQIVSKDVSQAGKPLGAINLCKSVAPNPCNPALPNGLSGVTVIDSGGALGSPDTTVYAGDLQGNLWKVDISAPDPKGWVVTLLFQARDSLGNPQPITDTPVVTLSPAFPSAPGTVVYFGTGQYLGAPDITNTNTQSFYAVLDNGAGTVSKAQLVQQVLTAVGAGASTAGGTTTSIATRTVTNNPVNWSTQSGWYMNLPLPGERVVTNPRIYLGEVVFTTYVPSPAALCTGGGQSFLMVLNYGNGGAFPTPQLDISGDGKLNANDQLASGANPVGIGLGSVYASAPDILSANLGSIQAVKLTTISTPNGLSNGNIVSLGEAGGTPAKITWTQLQ